MHTIPIFYCILCVCMCTPPKYCARVRDETNVNEEENTINNVVCLCIYKNNEKTNQQLKNIMCVCSTHLLRFFC